VAQAQSAGAHFCTGGWNPTGKTLEMRNHDIMLCAMIFYSSVRAVYGQLNGGGIALALAADWIVVP